MKYPTHILALTLLTTGSFAAAQTTEKPTQSAAAKSAQESISSRSCPDCSVRTFYVKYATQPADINEIAASLRQLLPDSKIFIMPSQDAVVIRANPEDMALAERLLNELDRPKKSWRLTYTLTEIDGNNRLGTQHYSMNLVDGQQSTLKQGSRVPILVTPPAGAQTLYNYQDIGITLDATLDANASGARLRTNVEQNGLTDAPGSAASTPIIRQSILKGSFLLTPNKPLILGAMDIPGSTHHLEVEALIEPLP